MRIIKQIATLVLLVAVARTTSAATVDWVDVAAVPGAANVQIDDPNLGRIRVSTSFGAQDTFSMRAGSLGELSWSAFEYINYDGSSTGTNSPISATMTFEFLDGPIDTSVTAVYFSAIGLAETSSYTIDNNPVYLGDIGTAEGTGVHTVLGNGLLRIGGAGFNHNPDLFFFDEASISSIEVAINQTNGDGTGFTIGAVLVPLPAALPLLTSAVMLLGFARASGRPHHRQASIPSGRIPSLH